MLFVIVISFSSETSIVEKGYSFLPRALSLDAYIYLLDNISYIGRAFLLSAVVTIMGTVLSLWLIGTMAFALILPQACSTWYILVMRTYFRENISSELLDAAKIDGAGTLRTFFAFVIPLAKPIITTIGLLEAFAYWNSWYYAMIYIRPEHRELYPLQYVLYSLQKNAEFLAGSDNISGQVIARVPTETFRMAVVVIITIPIIAAYPLIRKHFVKGIMLGVIK